jgi:hypothetical protein
MARFSPHFPIFEDTRRRGTLNPGSQVGAPPAVHGTAFPGAINVGVTLPQATATAVNPVLSSLEHHWDMSVFSSLTLEGGGTLIRKIDDLIPGGRPLLSTQLAEPTRRLNYTTLLGHPVASSHSTNGSSNNRQTYLRPADATGTSAQIWGTGGSSAPAIPQPWTGVVVCARRNTGTPLGRGTPFDFKNDLGGTANQSRCDFNTDLGNVLIVHGTTTTNTDVDVAVDTPVVFVWVGDGANTKIYQNGVLKHTHATGVNFAMDVVTIFNDEGGNNGHDLYWMECQVGPGVEPNIASLSSMLLAKWS